MKRGRFNKYEKALIEKIEEAKRYCRGELELDFLSHYEEECLNGWYAMDYKECLGGAFEINANGYDKKPLISGDEADKYNVDVIKCCSFCNICYVG